MLLGLTNWLSCYGEIVFVQVIKEASEIPENLKPYASKVKLSLNNPNRINLPTPHP